MNAAARVNEAADAASHVEVVGDKSESARSYTCHAHYRRCTV